MANRLLYRRHALQRMQTRQISAAEVRTVLEQGDTIESYPLATPLPSRLVVGMTSRGPLHIVVADDPAAAATYVITVYRPDPRRWDPTFRVRRRP